MAANPARLTNHPRIRTSLIWMVLESGCSTIHTTKGLYQELSGTQFENTIWHSQIFEKTIIFHRPIAKKSGLNPCWLNPETRKWDWIRTGLNPDTFFSAKIQAPFFLFLSSKTQKNNSFKKKYHFLLRSHRQSWIVRITFLNILWERFYKNGCGIKRRMTATKYSRFSCNES